MTHIALEINKRVEGGRFLFFGWPMNNSWIDINRLAQNDKDESSQIQQNRQTTKLAQKYNNAKLSMHVKKQAHLSM